MSVPRLIKKYPNRRLYDSGVRRYIDLLDIRALVSGGTDFMVVEKASGQDITRDVLLQVITAQEQAPGAMMSESFMVNLIRAHGTSRHAGIAAALEETVKRVD
jgi:polyhydroxyalkanoate synthesis repressor PhaR